MLIIEEMGLVLCGRNSAENIDEKTCQLCGCRRSKSEKAFCRICKLDMCETCKKSHACLKEAPKAQTRIKDSWQVPIRISCDKAVPTITGCKFMSGNQLVLCDAANKRIKVLDSSLGIKLIVDLSIPPYDVGIIDDENIIVSMPTTNRIKFIQIFPVMVLGPSFSVGSICYGINVANDEIFVACRCTARDVCLQNQMNDSEIKIYNMHGEIQNRLLVNACTCCITVNRSGTKIYALTSCGIICLSRHSEVIFHYRFGGLSEPRSLCLDEDNNIIVCCSDLIQFITACGKRHRTISKMDDVSGASNESVFMPNSVAFRSDRTLVVAGERQSKLLVYKMM